MTRPTDPRPTERGSIMFAALLLTIISMGFAYSMIVVSSAELNRSQVVADSTKAAYAAETGFELGIEQLRDFVRKAAIDRPFAGIDGLLLDGSARVVNQLYVDHDLLHDGLIYGTVNIQLSLADAGPDYRDVVVTVDAYVPKRYVMMNGERRERFDAHERVQQTVRVAVRRAEVFDYGCFVNDSIAMGGMRLVVNGNVRLNGQFDGRDQPIEINGTPRYRSIERGVDPATGAATIDLSGYEDDNDDGRSDGTDGGIYASGAIVATTAMTGGPANLHQDRRTLRMPNLNDLARYEAAAKGRMIDGVLRPTSVRVGDALVSNAVYGDESGEPGDLVLVGTVASPIRIDGLVVVRGDLLISGVVTGRGCLYVAGSIFVTGDLRYANPPLRALPASPLKAHTEQWIASNLDRDMLGLFAAGNVVIGNGDRVLVEAERTGGAVAIGGGLAEVSTGDAPGGESPNEPTDPTDPDRSLLSALDGGALFELTRPFLGGDVSSKLLGRFRAMLAEDGMWSVESYSEADATLGAIPDGMNVGDPIPGTGEDVDGDGAPDAGLSWKDLTLSGSRLAPAAENVIVSTTIQTVDATIYTNQALLLQSETDVVINGALVTRSMIGAYRGLLTINHDRRLTAGGIDESIALPVVFPPIEDRAFGTETPTGIRPIDPIPVRLAVDPADGGLTGKLARKVQRPDAGGVGGDNR